MSIDAGLVRVLKIEERDNGLGGYDVVFGIDDDFFTEQWKEKANIDMTVNYEKPSEVTAYSFGQWYKVTLTPTKNPFEEDDNASQ